MGLPLRAGLHTGEIELRGRDVGGIAVHAAARVMAHCAPGEVLVSRVVTDLVAGAGLNFAERGSHELKGLPGRWDFVRGEPIRLAPVKILVPPFAMVCRGSDEWVLRATPPSLATR